MTPAFSGDPKENAFLVTCEHGGNRVPAPYRPYFTGWEELLQSHSGHDPGALVLARALAEALGAPLVASTVTRLLVDLNRSPRHRQLFSEALRGAPRPVREKVLSRYYRPYRQRGEDLVAEAVAGGRRVVHISSHSFTPVVDNVVRNADVGLLYDPGRPEEVALCDAWQEALGALAPQFKVRRNFPYAGRADGFCLWLRRRFGAGDYVGIELEINQRHFLVKGLSWRELRLAVVVSLQKALGGAGLMPRPGNWRASRP